MRRLARRRGLFVLLLSLALCFVLTVADISGVVWPAESGKTKTKGEMTVDYGNDAEGYIMVHGESSKKKLKLRISKDGTTLTYDLNTDGDYEVFPLQLGDGSYKITLYKNVKSSKYSEDGTMKLKVKLNSDYAAYLCPNQFVNYTKDSAPVAKSDELCEGMESDRDKYDAIHNFMKNNFVYDYIKALTVSAGELPDIEGCYEKRSGICQDLASIMACMLRVQGIPSTVVVGYANTTYHAWLITYLDGTEEFCDITKEVGGITGNLEYTAEKNF